MTKNESVCCAHVCPKSTHPTRAKTKYIRKKCVQSVRIKWSQSHRRPTHHCLGRAAQSPPRPGICAEGHQCLGWQAHFYYYLRWCARRTRSAARRPPSRPWACGPGSTAAPAAAAGSRPAAGTGCCASGTRCRAPRCSDSC